MKNEQIDLINAPESTLLGDCKGVAGANALCNCKDVCVQAPEPNEP